MTRLSDADHYAARLQAERKAIKQATCEKARAAHRELAGHYEKLLATAKPTVAASPTSASAELRSTAF